MINIGGMANIIYKIDLHKFYICVYTHTAAATQSLVMSDSL